MSKRQSGRNERDPIFPTADVTSSLDETSAGDAPDDWTLVRLGDIAADTKYGASEAAHDFDPSQPRYVRIKDIDELGRLKKDEKASLPCEKARGYLLEKGDLLFARSGSVGRTYLYQPSDGECCHGGYTIKHVLPSEGLNGRYLHQYTKSPPYWRWVERISRTGAQPNINSHEYGSLLLPLPPLEEQRKIASALYTVDELIEKTEALIQRYEALLEGLARDLITGAIAGRGDAKEVRALWRTILVPTEWEVRRLGEVADVVSGNALPEEYQDGQRGQYPVYKVSDMNREGNEKYMTESRHYLSMKVLDEIGHSVYPVNTVVLPKVGAALLTNKRRILNRRASFDNNIMGWIPGNEINGEFLYHMSRLVNMKAVAQMGAVPSISQSIARMMKVPLPPMEVQREISERMCLVEDLQNHERAIYRRLRRVKQGLMQDLLSGEIRTHDKNIEVLDEVAAYG